MTENVGLFIFLMGLVWVVIAVLSVRSVRRQRANHALIAAYRRRRAHEQFMADLDTPTFLREDPVRRRGRQYRSTR